MSRKGFSQCARPRTPANERALDGNQRLAQKRWNAAFGKPLDAAIARLKTVPSSPRSPIIEAIKALSWRPDFGSEIPRRRLVIFSDLLQNSPGLSQYQRRYDYVKWRKTEHARENAFDFRGVEVVIYYLQRPQTLRIQTDAHRDFWFRFLTESGAKVVFADGWKPTAPSAIDKDQVNTQVTNSRREKSANRDQ